MPSYRVTIRWGAPRARYEVLDIAAADLRAALTAAAARLSDEVAASAELAEVRVQADPDAREYVEES